MPRKASLLNEPASPGEPTHRPQGSKPQPAVKGLTLVATPIGNLGDMSQRALEVLRAVDLVLCEDTRVTQKLLRAYDLRPRLATYHEHNAEQKRPQLIAALKAGQSLALVSDAGMPLISDPGYKLVRAALDEELSVTAAPGASALLTALVLSGLPSDRFFFAGFLPNRQAARRKQLQDYADIPGTLLFYESAQRLAASLADMAAVLGDRPACVARELTKRFEELRRDSLAALAQHYDESGAPKGEVVVVVGPLAPVTASGEDLDMRLAEALAGASLRDAVARVMAETGLPRKDIYARALELKAASIDEP